MAEKQRAKRNDGSRTGEAATPSYWANPEVQKQKRSYAEFLARHPLAQAVMANDEKQIEEFFNELGI
jgi:hypothetical protein